MAEFTHKPGSFFLFKNKKDKDNWPDYTGEGMSMEGEPIRVSAWLKDGVKGKFMSCSITPKEAQAAKPQAKPDPFDDMDNDVPF